MLHLDADDVIRPIYLLFFCVQLGLFLKKVLNDDCISLSKSELLKVISKYLDQRTSLAQNNLSKFCICGGKLDGNLQRKGSFAVDGEVLDYQHRELEVNQSYNYDLCI